MIFQYIKTFLCQNRIKLYAICFIALCFAGCYILYGRDSANVDEFPRLLESSSKSSIQTVHNKTTVTKTIQPNGASVKTTVKDVVTSTTNSVQSERVSIAPKSVSLSRYSVQIVTSPFDYKAANIGIGARLGNLPAFGVIEYEIKENTVKAGIRVEW